MKWVRESHAMLDFELLGKSGLVNKCSVEFSGGNHSSCYCRTLPHTQHAGSWMLNKKEMNLTHHFTLRTTEECLDETSVLKISFIDFSDLSKS